MKRKQDLDTMVGILLTTRRADVSAITSAFLNELMNAVVADGEVHIDGFGRFRLVCRKGRRAATAMLTQGTFKKGVSKDTYLVPVDKKYFVTFKKATSFRDKIHKRFGKNKAIKEGSMEKFGVDESVDQETLEKKAANGCPECGRKLERHGRVLMCPVHGSEPFEAKR